METLLIPEWTLADRLRKARETAGLDQQQLANAIGVARQTISNYEKGHTATRPMALVIRQWALATGVDEQWLRTGIVRGLSGDRDVAGDGDRSTGWYDRHHVLLRRYLARARDTADPEPHPNNVIHLRPTG